MRWPERIVTDPSVLAGKPIIRGTRLAVEFVLDLLAAGQSEADIGANYPGLAHEDVLACLAYASHLAHEYKAYPLPVCCACLETKTSLPSVEAFREAAHDVIWVRTDAPGAG